MSLNDTNPNHAYAVTVGATAVGWLSNLDTFLHIAASVVVIISGATAIYTWIINRNKPKV